MVSCVQDILREMSEVGRTKKQGGTSTAMHEMKKEKARFKQGEARNTSLTSAALVNMWEVCAVTVEPSSIAAAGT